MKKEEKHVSRVMNMIVGNTRGRGRAEKMD
jgi:hypothetical protein